ncbi:MAG: prepilin-type N-terminal cleavage/methylation domain-containing protein [Gemmatimonadales bacterium]
MHHARRGFTLIEALVVVTMIGIMSAIVIPRFRVSEATNVRQAARQLAGDLELARTRALSTTSMVRVVFNTAAQSYSGYLDNNRDGAFAQSVTETNALGAFQMRLLTNGVRMARGATPNVPGMTGAGAITLPGSRVEFATQGITNPFGTTGVIYLTSANDANAVAAVSVSAAAGVRVWVYKGGAWQ